MLSVPLKMSSVGDVLNERLFTGDAIISLSALTSPEGLIPNIIKIVLFFFPPYLFNTREYLMLSPQAWMLVPLPPTLRTTAVV